MVMDDPALVDGGWMSNITLATNPPTIAQFLPGTGDLSPFSLLNVKTSDNSYFVLVSEQNNASKTQVWNVTDYRRPVKMPDQMGRSIMESAKSSNGSRVGVVQWDYIARVYTSDAV